MTTKFDWGNWNKYLDYYEIWIIEYAIDKTNDLYETPISTCADTKTSYNVVS